MAASGTHVAGPSNLVQAALFSLRETNQCLPEANDIYLSPASYDHDTLVVGYIRVGLKARHLKCSEERPVCKRCETSGRTCKYEDPKPRRRPDQFTFVNYAAEATIATLPRPSRDWREERAFAYFRECTAADLAGPIESVFFSQILLAIAEHESIVRHAISALGALHEVYGHLDTQQLPEFALSQYGKAIKGVVELQATPNPQAIEITLTSCILFSLLESMRGFHHSSMSHLIAGLKVFRENYLFGSSDLSTKSTLYSSLLWLFIRVDNQVMDVGGAEFGNSVQVYDPMQGQMPYEFSSLAESMFHIDLLYNRVMYVLGKWEPIISTNGQTDSITHGWFNDRAYYGLELERFHAAHRRMLTRSDPANFEKQQAGLLAIALASKTTAILLQVDDYVNPERDFDRSLALFQAMVEESEAFIDLCSSPVLDDTAIVLSAQSTQNTDTHFSSTASSPNLNLPQTHPPRRSSTTSQHSKRRPILTMTSGCVLPLYFVAARCRHGPTRHRALHLLQICNRREGLWDSRLSAGIAEKLIDLEETKAKALLLEQQQQSKQHLRGHKRSLAQGGNLRYSPQSVSPHSSDDDASAIDADQNEQNEQYTTQPHHLSDPFSPENLAIPDEARIRTVVMHYSKDEGQEHTGKAEFSMRPPWSIVPEPGNRYAGLGSVEQVGFGTPGPRVAVSEVVLKS